MSRIYHFRLPYRMSATNVFYGVWYLKKEKAFEHLPFDIQDKMMQAQSSWHPLVITKEDLDRIPDDIWVKISEKLNLKYDNVDDPGV